MEPLYIVTGAAGFLGNNIVRLLQNKGRIKAFVLSTDDLQALDGLNCEIVYGNVMDQKSLDALFQDTNDAPVYLIHCAGMVDIKNSYDPRVYGVNVIGTKNVAQACLAHHAKMIYISSVHAMPPIEKNGKIEPASTYDPALVPGLYAKAKAQASRIVLDLVSKGLHACLIQPSGLIGPNDFSNTNLTQFIAEAANGKLPACVKAGYSFVDVRDAAAAIIAACEKGKDGVSYIVAGPTVSMQTIADLACQANHSKPIRFEVPLGLVEMCTPFTDFYYKITDQKPLYTAFAVHTLKTKSNFDIASAQDILGFVPRPIEQTISDTVDFLKQIFRVDTDCVIVDHKPEKTIKTSNALLIAAMIATGAFALKKHK